MERLGRWRTLSALVVTLAVAGCAAVPSSPSTPPKSSPGEEVTPAASPTPSPTPLATSEPAATPTPGAIAENASVVRSDTPRAPAKPAAARQAAASIAAFGIDLYQRLLADGTLETKDNAVLSPTSIALALGMARAGAKGATADEMDAVLHTTGWGALGKGLNALEQSLSSRDATWKDEEGATHVLRLRIANAAFAQRGWSIVPGYLDAIASAFGAGLRLVDYEADPEGGRQTINAWVKKRTAGRIPELIGAGILTPLTRLVLVDAIYLKANWEIEFGEEGYGADPTAPRRFARLDGSAVRVPTMSLYGGQTVPLASGSGWKATELRYLGSRDGEAGDSTPLAMTLILPDDLRAFEKGLTPTRLVRIVSKTDAERERLQDVSYTGRDDEMDCGTYPYQVRVFMPRFGIDTHASLAESIAALGMPLAFDFPRADFTGIHVPEDEGDSIYIEDVIHQANLDVDEKGTEAAAATAVVMSTGGCTGPDPARTATIRLNRPFLFVLRDVETGAILFMGRVVDP
jgi:serpin B